jgi:KUP system potassium uptake protein
MHYGFAEQPNLAHDLNLLTGHKVSFDPKYTSFFLGRERLDLTEHQGMAPWRERLFVFLHRNAADPAAHFGLPRERSMDIGTHVDI